MVFWKYPILEAKRSPRSFGCSWCGKEVSAGNTYCKTNYGRYCKTCAKKLPSVEKAEEMLAERR